MSTEIVLPAIMQVGAAAVQRLPDVLSNLGCQHPCIVTDKTMVELGVAERIQQILSDAQMATAVFADVMQEPDDQSINAAVTMVAAGNFDCLVALGGGSAIDSAKAIALLASHGGEMRDYKMPNLNVDSRMRNIMPLST